MILAASIAAAVAGFLLGPRLLDGDLARERFVRRLEALTGDAVRVRGATSFTFLPVPRLSLGELVIGDPARGTVLATVERVDLVLGVAGVLGLDSAPSEIRLVRPSVRAAGAPDPTRVSELLRALGSETIELGAISIAGGRLTLRDPQLPAPLELVDLDLELARQTGNGPLGLSGGGRLRDQPVSIELELRPATAGPHLLRAQLVIGAGPEASRLAYRGALEFRREGARWDGELEIAARSDRLRALLDALGAGEFVEFVPPIGPFAARGRITAEPAGLRADALRVATTVGELQLAVSLGREPPHPLRLEIDAPRLELPADTDPTGWAHALWSGLWAGPPATLVGTVAVRVGTLSRAGEALRRVRARLDLPGSGVLEVEELAAELPGVGDLTLDGRLAREAAGPIFRGRLEAFVEDPRPLLTWLGQPAPGLAERLGAVGVQGALHATPEGVSLSGAELRLAGARARGTASLLAGPPLRLRVSAEIDRLTLDPWLTAAPREILAHWLAAGPPDELAAELDLTIDRLAWGAARGEHARIRAELAGGRLRLDELSSPDLAGSRLRASGTLGPGPAVDVEASIETDQPARLARALDLDPALAALVEGPLTGRARLHEDDGAWRLAVELVTTDARLRADLATAPGSLQPRRVDLAARLADLAAAAARAGGPGIRGTALAGPLDLQLRAERIESGFSIEAGFGAGRLAATARVDLLHREDVPLLRGRLTLERVSDTALADLYHLLEVPLGLPPGPLRAWPGAWPRRALGLANAAPIDLDLALELGLETAEGTPLGRGGAALAMAGRSLALDSVDLRVAGGRLAGRLLVEAAPEAARIDTELTLASADLPGLAEALRAAHPGEGLLDLELRLASEGRSLFELLANARGEGRLVVRELPPLGTDADGDARVVLHGPFVVERGLVRAGELVLERAGRPSAAGTLGFDLANWILDLELRGDPGPIRWLGPPDRLRRYGDLPPPR